MSDDFLEGDDEGTGADVAKSEGGKKKIGFLPAIVIQILKWAAIIIGLIILIVTIVIITLNIIGATGSGQMRTDVTQEYLQATPQYEYFALDELRGVTSDEIRNTFVVEVQIGYDPDDQATVNEIILRRVQIIDQLLLWFGSQNATYLENSRNREEIRSRLKALINQIMTRDIREVRFTAFQIMNF